MLRYLFLSQMHEELNSESNQKLVTDIKRNHVTIEMYKDIEIGRKLCEGSFGTVFECLVLSKPFDVKVVNVYKYLEQGFVPDEMIRGLLKEV